MSSMGRQTDAAIQERWKGSARQGIHYADENAQLGTEELDLSFKAQPDASAAPSSASPLSINIQLRSKEMRLRRTPEQIDAHTNFTCDCKFLQLALHSKLDEMPRWHVQKSFDRCFGRLCLLQLS
jgi:hypothetical protein